MCKTVLGSPHFLLYETTKMLIVATQEYPKCRIQRSMLCILQSSMFRKCIGKWKGKVEFYCSDVKMFKGKIYIVKAIDTESQALCHGFRERDRETQDRSCCAVWKWGKFGSTCGGKQKQKPNQKNNALFIYSFLGKDRDFKPTNLWNLKKGEWRMLQW